MTAPRHDMAPREVVASPRAIGAAAVVLRLVVIGLVWWSSQRYGADRELAYWAALAVGLATYVTWRRHRTLERADGALVLDPRAMYGASHRDPRPSGDRR